MSEKSPIRIFLADDHPLLRAGLRMSLNRNEALTVMGEANNGFKAVQKILDDAPDVLLIDVDMPGLSGIEAIRVVRPSLPEMIILMLSNYSDEEYIKDAMEAGADGYISKNIEATDLIGLIKSFYHRTSVVSPYLINLSVSHSKPEAPPASPSFDLSSREKQVLFCISEGKSNKEISNDLFISLETVKSHTKNIFRKLKVNNRVEAANRAWEIGIVNKK